MIVRLVYTHHALQRWHERVGDFKPKQTLNLTNGEALLERPADETQNRTIYSVADRGHFYSMVVREIQDGRLLVITINPKKSKTKSPPRYEIKRKWKRIPKEELRPDDEA